MLNNWTEREKWFLALVGFCLFLLFSLVIYLNMNASEIAAEDSFEEMGLSVNDAGRPLALGSATVSQWDGEMTQLAKVSKSIIVDVKGEVVLPGVYTLDAGSRVDDAIRMAGGETADADLNAVNLAEPLTDGAIVYVPNQEEKGQSISNVNGNVPGLNPSGGANGSPTGSGRVSLNKAGLKELMSLPGIGESKANAIIAYRTDNGGFRSIDELLNIKGIGPKILERIRDRMVVD